MNMIEERRVEDDPDVSYLRNGESCQHRPVD